MKAVTNVVRKHARRLAPRGKGPAVNSKGNKRKRLAQSIRTRILKKGMDGAVYATAPHAHLVHGGTKPHNMAAKGARVFKIGGHIIRTKSLHHPGAKAQPFLTDAAEQSRGEIATAIKGIIG